MLFSYVKISMINLERAVSIAEKKCAPDPGIVAHIQHDISIFYIEEVHYQNKNEKRRIILQNK